jgi:hypothetical protein
MAKIRAILIDPVNQSITETELESDAGGMTTLRSIYKATDCDCITTVRLGGDRNITFDMYLDDMGLYREEQFFFDIAGYGHTLAGKAVITGTNQGGDTVALPRGITVDMIAQKVTFRGKMEGNRPEPYFEIRTLDWKE